MFSTTVSGTLGAISSLVKFQIARTPPSAMTLATRLASARDTVRTAISTWCADERGIDIEGADDGEAVSGKVEVFQQRMAEVAYAHDDDGEAALRAENGCDLVAQELHVVPVALLSEFAEIGEILPDLRGGQTHLPSQLARGDARHAVRGEIVQLADIARQTADHIVGYVVSSHIETSETADRMSQKAFVPEFYSV